MSKIDLSRHEFLLDRAAYFADKPRLYLEIKQRLAHELSQSVSSIRVCGSAYWGRKYADGSDFEPGRSDLDVAIVSARLFAQCMSEVRAITSGFTDLTPFPMIAGENGYARFQQYALQKGMLSLSFLPRIKTGSRLKSVSEVVSRDYLDHFSNISICVYDSDDAFAVKQAGAYVKLKGK